MWKASLGIIVRPWNLAGLAQRAGGHTMPESMNGTQAARLWMLLKTEQALGLKSVPWRLRAVAVTATPPTVAVPVPRPYGTPTARPMAAAPRATAMPRPADSPAREPSPRTVPPLSLPVHPATLLKETMREPLTASLLPLSEREAVMAELNEKQVKPCQKCRLCQERKQTVFGEGSLEAQLFFIGEGPGADEDETGRPFVGRSGQLLTKMIIAMGLSREQVFIGNVVKCRPPGNRTPTPEEVATCTPYLVKQLEVIRPRVIVTLGLPATQYMLQTSEPMRALRGIWQDWRGIKLMPTYHPSYVLRSYTPEVRGAVWSDLQKVMEELGLPSKGKVM